MDNGLALYKAIMGFIVSPVIGFLLFSLLASWFSGLIESRWAPIRAFGTLLWVGIPLAMTLNATYWVLQIH